MALSGLGQLLPPAPVVAHGLLGINPTNLLGYYELPCPPPICVQSSTQIGAFIAKGAVSRSPKRGSDDRPR